MSKCFVLFVEGDTEVEFYKHDTLQAGFFQKNVFKKKGVQIKVLETAIAGMYFHIEGEQDEQNLDELIPGTELKLYRDAENEFDEWVVGE